MENSIVDGTTAEEETIEQETTEEETFVIEKVELDMFTDLAKNTANVC